MEVNDKCDVIVNTCAEAQAYGRITVKLLKKILASIILFKLSVEFLDPEHCHRRQHCVSQLQHPVM
jgi:hypothetical protein